MARSPPAFAIVSISRVYVKCFRGGWVVAMDQGDDCYLDELILDEFQKLDVSVLDLLTDPRKAVEFADGVLMSLGSEPPSDVSIVLRRLSNLCGEGGAPTQSGSESESTVVHAKPR